MFTIINIANNSYLCTSVYRQGESNIMVTSSHLSIPSWIINFDMNSEIFRFFCIVSQALLYCFSYYRRRRKSVLYICLFIRKIGVWCWQVEKAALQRGQADINLLDTTEPLKRFVTISRETETKECMFKRVVFIALNTFDTVSYSKSFKFFMKYQYPMQQSEKELS